MPTYEKLTLDRFKLSLKEGKYKNLTGARRAVGKVKSWTPKEREGAYELANKHFGEASPAPKAAAKAGAKRGPKPKKFAAVAKAPKAAAKATPAPTGAKRGRPRKVQAETAEVGSVMVAPIGQEIQRAFHFDSRQIAAQNMLTFAASAQQALHHAQTVNPGLNTKDSHTGLVDLVNNAIVIMRESTAHLTAKPEAAADLVRTTTPARIELPKSAPVESPKPLVQAAPETPATVKDEDLSPAERQAKDMFQQSSPDILANLPAPPQS